MRLSAFVLAVLSACVPIGTMAGDAVRYTASYLQRMALPPDAVLEVRVEDVSRADARAEVMGVVRVENPGAPPFHGSVTIDTDKIDARNRYSVRASIRSGDRLLMVTDQAYPVLTGGNGHDVEMLLRPVGMPAGVAAAAPLPLGELPASFAGDLPCADCAGIRYQLNLFPDRSFFLTTTYLGREVEHPDHDIGSWSVSSDGHVLLLMGGREAPIMLRIDSADALRKLDLEGSEITSELNYMLTRDPQFMQLEPRLMLRGLYRYFADAATFTECLTGQRWPVAQTADNVALERAYRQARSQPGAELMVSLEGSIEIRPGMEGDRLRPTLVPQRFIGVWPGETCGERFTTAPLDGTEWKLVQLDGNAVIVDDERRAPGLLLKDHRVSGSTGCNRLTGDYRIDADEIGFTALATTRMACPNAMATEKAMLNALQRAVRWNALGHLLELYDAQGARIARFAARAGDPAAGQ